MLDVILVGAALSAPQPMNMPIVCGQAAHIEAAIAGKFQEQPQAMGLTADGGVMTVWTSSLGDWTITTRKPDGSGCMIGTGNSLSVLSPVFGDPS